MSFVIFKGSIFHLLNLNFTLGDLWIVGAAISWAFFSSCLINWKSKFSIFSRFVLMSFFASMILLPFFLLEHFYFMPTTFDYNFIFFVILASIFPGIVAFIMYTKLQQMIGASLPRFWTG